MQISLFTNGKTNTKSVMKASISLAVVAMLLTAALAIPAAAQNQVPFKGSLQGHENDTPQGGPPEPHGLAVRVRVVHTRRATREVRVKDRELLGCQPSGQVFAQERHKLPAAQLGSHLHPNTRAHIVHHRLRGRHQLGCQGDGVVTGEEARRKHAGGEPTSVFGRPG